MTIEGPGLACLCGWDGLLIVACASWDIAEAVARHQARPEHVAARRRVNNAEANRLHRARVRDELACVRRLRDLELERTSVRFGLASRARACENAEDGSSVATIANMSSTPFGSLTLLSGVAASRGQD